MERCVRNDRIAPWTAPFCHIARFFYGGLLLLLVVMPPPAMAEGKGDLSLWSTVPYLNWVKQTPAPLEQFSFFINGVQAGTKTVQAVKHKDSLHVRLPLAYEKQTTVEIRTHGEVVYRADIFYAPSYESNMVPDGSTYLPFHTADNEQPCQECHRLTITPSDLDPTQVKEQVCYSCHQHKFDGMKRLHKPAAVQWRCLECHQAEAQPNKSNPDQPLRFTVAGEGDIAQLCYRCHKKVEEQINDYPFLHGPIGMGGCNLCHNPHASNWPKILQNNLTTLCINCHEFKEEIKKPVIHQVIKTKGCTPCHHPHGGKYPLQLPGTINDTCTRCHPAILKQTNNHPVQNHPTLIKARPQDKKDKLTCVSCHAPHAAGASNLLLEDETIKLCNHCHPRGTK